MEDLEISKSVMSHLKNVDRLHGEKYNSPEELLGFLTEEYHETLETIHLGRGRYMESTKRELLDIMVVCWKGLRSCK